MRLQPTENVLGSVLEQYSIQPVHRCISRRRLFSTTTVARQNQRIAVVGGGITGLATAHYLARDLPSASITLFESGTRLGGWIRSDVVNLKDRHVLFERGPRTLRPYSVNGRLTLNLIEELGIADQVIKVNKSNINSGRRYLYYPDHLVALPDRWTNVFLRCWRLFTEPLYSGLLSGLYHELNTPKRPQSLDDESIGDFFSRRLGSDLLVNNLMSAMIHGIYAGDIWKLSARSLLPLYWEAEDTVGSLAEYHVNVTFGWKPGMILMEDQKLLSILNNETRMAGGYHANLTNMNQTMVYTFNHGMEQLVIGLKKALLAEGVNIRTQTKVEGLKVDTKGESVKLMSSQTNNPKPRITTEVFSHVVVTTSPSDVSPLPKPVFEYGITVPSSVHVMTVNLYYPTPHLKPGFGYLIPQSVPFDLNPERALGVIWDSNVAPQHDSKPGTKITVMLGGHYWSGWTSFPSENEGVEMAMTILARHLGITEQPLLAEARLHRNCIPQYEVGHEKNMKKLRETLQVEGKGRISVAGASYKGVGLNDCIRSAYDTTRGIVENGWMTGLEGLGEKKHWVKLPKRGISAQCFFCLVETVVSDDYASKEVEEDARVRRESGPLMQIPEILCCVLKQQLLEHSSTFTLNSSKLMSPVDFDTT
ncbi:MAG: oxygen-dependent protoporphyrinogen oxidase [Cirrosporium novae-zelandiae]|nr:MAG: oxygen-dependent protoporphyrinogen oxidase [Cirrosporium novae-zelandiae]